MSIVGGCLGCGGGSGAGVKTVTFPEDLNANGDMSDAAAAPPWSCCDF